MTGPETLTMSEAAATPAEETGREVTFDDEKVDESCESRKPWCAPPWPKPLDAGVSTYTAIRAGGVRGVTDDVPRLPGREPLGLRDLLRGRA